MGSDKVAYDKSYIIEKIHILEKLLDENTKLYKDFACQDETTSFYEITNLLYKLKDTYQLPKFIKDYIFKIETYIDVLSDNIPLIIPEEDIDTKKTEEIISLMSKLKIKINDNNKFKDLNTALEKDACINQLKAYIEKTNKNNSTLDVYEEQDKLDDKIIINNEEIKEITLENEEIVKPNLKNSMASISPSTNIIIFSTTITILIIFVVAFIVLKTFIKNKFLC